MTIYYKQTHRALSVALLLITILMLGACSNFVAYFARSKMIDTSVYPENFAQYADKVVLIKNLTYPSKYPSNTYDLYLPKLSSSTQKVPVIIWVHGGAFVGGDKSQVINTSTMMASEGYVVVSMNYQLAPEGKYPVPINQLQEMYTHLSALKKMNPMMDTDKLFFGGDSAGAQIASQFVALQTNPQLAKEMKLPQVVPTKSILGVLLYCGPFDPARITQTDNDTINSLFKHIGTTYIGKKDWETSPEAKQTNVIANVTKDYPPAYITDGNYFSFPDHGKALVAALREKGVTVQERFYDDNPRKIFHEFQVDFSKPEAWDVFNDTVEFLKKYSQ